VHAVPGVAPVAPARSDLLALQELVRLGFYRGITNKLDAIVASQPATASFARALGELARQFQFETMLTQLQQELDANHAR
jgi:hypothetical protein